MLFEHHTDPLLPPRDWLRRFARSVWVAVVIMLVALGLGTLGYATFGDLNWIDALLEASMILSGMGPVAPMKTQAVKLFASFYALLSGFVVLTCVSVVLAPVLHRMMHHHFRQTSSLH